MDNTDTPVTLTKKVTTLHSGQGYIISLPNHWMNLSGYPDRIVVVLGDILLITTPQNRERVEVLAKLLVEKDLITLLPDKKAHRNMVEIDMPEMAEVA